MTVTPTHHASLLPLPLLMSTGFVVALKACQNAARRVFSPLRFLALAFVAMSTLSSCEDRVDIPPVGYSGSEAITGVVVLGDEFQRRIPYDPAIPVTASIRGEGVDITVEADQEGRYRFNSVPGGIYEITLSAPGFPAIRRPRVDHQGSRVTEVPETMIAQVSTTRITEATVDTIRERTVQRFRRDQNIPAGTQYRVPANVTIRWRRQLTNGSFQTDSIRTQTDTVLVYPRDSTINVPDSNVTIQKFVLYLATIDPATVTSDAQPRGIALYLSNRPDVAVGRALLRIKFSPFSADNDRLGYIFRVQDLIDYGVVSFPRNQAEAQERPFNNRIYARVYGTSGRKSFLGSFITEDMAGVFDPLVNQEGGSQLIEIVVTNPATDVFIRP